MALMAFPKRGSRFLTVDGVRYRWRIPRADSDRDDGWPGVMFAASPVECDGAILYVSYPRNFQLDGPCGDRGWPILPGEVARRIRDAVTAGWQVDRPGRPHTVVVKSVGIPD